jgi:hypothetical protein
MGCRRQSRTVTELTVSLCGTDAKGRAYIERVVTDNISRDGALLEGVRGPVRVGDTVVVRCADNTGRFRAIWEKYENDGTKRLGLMRLTPSTKIEDFDRPENEPDDYKRPRSAVRRKSGRYKCEVAAELRLKHIQTPMWVTSVNLGEDGCAVNTLVSVPAGTELNIAMWLGGEKVWAQGIVVTSLYGLGTGIHFTSVSKQGREHLESFLAQQTEIIPDRRAEGVVEVQPCAETAEKEPEEFTVAIPLIYEESPVAE